MLVTSTPVLIATAVTASSRAAALDLSVLTQSSLTEVLETTAAPLLRRVASVVWVILASAPGRITSATVRSLRASVSTRGLVSAM